MDQNFLNFMQFLGKSGKFVCWRPPKGLAPPPTGNPVSATGYHNLRIVPSGRSRTNLDPKGGGGEAPTYY